MEMSKNIIITGANTGIGYETAKGLVSKYPNARIIIACRNLDKAKVAATELGDNVEAWKCDLSSLESVRTFASEFRRHHSYLDILINNAGCVTVSKETSVDGYEMIFASNYLGHFFLTLLLIPCLRRAISKPARIVNVSSRHSQKVGRFEKDDSKSLQGQGHESWNPIAAYGDSKLAQVLFTRELSLRLQEASLESDIVVHACHPGVVASNIWFRNDYQQKSFIMGTFFRLILNPIVQMVGMTTEQGAQMSLYLSTSDEAIKNSGGYWLDMKRVEESALTDITRDAEAAEICWRRSLRFVGWTDTIVDKQLGQ